MLPQFQLAQVIAKHNQNHKTNYHDSETFKFPYFKASILPQTNEAIELLNGGEYLFRWTSKEKECLQNSQQKLRQHQLKLRNLPTQSLAQKRFSAEIKERIRQKNIFYSWTETVNNNLKYPKVWEKWLISDNVFNKIKVGALKKLYENSSHFMLYEPDTLIYFAEDLLPDLIQHHLRAKKILSRYKAYIPAEIYKEYKNYLDDFLNKTVSYKKKLADAMLLRLEVFSERKLKNSHPIVYFHEELKNTGAIAQEETQPEFQQVLTEKQFQYFHRYIEKSDNEPAKTKSKSLNWFKNESCLLKTCVICAEEDYFFVPESLYGLIPLAPKSPRWLFKGSNLRHEYFKDKNILLAKMKLYPDIAFTVDNLFQKKILKNTVKELNNLQMELDNEILNISHHKFFNLSFIRSKTKAFFKFWIKQLEDYRGKILEDKLVLVEKISESLEKLDLASTIIRGWSQCSVANDLIQTLEKDLKAIPVPNPILQRFSNIQKKLSQQLANYKLFKIIRQLSKGYLLKTEEFAYFLDLNKIMQLNNPENYRDFLGLCQPSLSNIQNLLYTLLKQSPFKSAHYQDDRDLILMLNIVIEKCCDAPVLEKHQIKMDSLISKYFVQYMEILLKTSQNPDLFDKSEKTILAMEEIIKLLGKNKSYANKTLKTHIEEIQELRVLVKQGDVHWNVLESRCYALLSVILPILINNRFNKDIHTFDQHLFSLIQTDESLNYSHAVLENLSQIFQQQESVNDLNHLQLKPEEKALVGMNGGNADYINQLMNMRGRLYMRKKSINSPFTDLREKLLIASDAANDVKSCITNCDKTRSLSHFYRTRSLRHPLFSKSYIDSTMLSNIVHSRSLNDSNKHKNYIN